MHRIKVIYRATIIEHKKRIVKLFPSYDKAGKMKHKIPNGSIIIKPV